MKIAILAFVAIVTILVAIGIIFVQSQGKSGQCIVTVFGKQYDVTELKDTHSGGDIFECGTDVSQVYQSQHGTKVGRIQQYLIP